jgi:hypothetical protein
MSDVGDYIVIRKLLDSIFNICYSRIGGKFKCTYIGHFLHKVAYLRYDVL